MRDACYLTLDAIGRRLRSYDSDKHLEFEHQHRVRR